MAYSGAASASVTDRSIRRRRGVGEFTREFLNAVSEQLARVEHQCCCKVAGVENTQGLRLCSRRQLQPVQESRQKRRRIARRSARLLAC